MRLSRREFLQSALLAASRLPGNHQGFQFVDVAKKVGLRDKVYYGSATWTTILEATGGGVAFGGYGNDRWVDTPNPIGIAEALDGFQRIEPLLQL